VDEVLQAELRRALEDGEIEAHFQPIADMLSGDVVGVEALSRWTHRTRGSVGPDVFVPIAEDDGLIVDLDRAVLRRSCAWAATWRRRHPADREIYVSVNVSSLQLQRPDFVADVVRALTASGLPARLLVLEITERLMMLDTEMTLSQLRELKELGVRLALDDFGTGFSSLSYLLRFPFDVLKIDRSFVRELGNHHGVPRVVSAIVALGDTLGLQCVAEGVERPSEVDALIDVGCRLGQGFYFGRPMPAAELEHHLSRVFSFPPGVARAS
jgi:EAL domain-containing protein (putative c-di-GMP-specific phosphodiesterase class I)